MAENHTIIIREEMAEPESPVVDADAAVPAEITAASESGAEPSSKRARAKKRERVIVLSTGPYLPITGALPLRFASARKWPAPLPATEPAREALPTVVATAAAPDSRPSENLVEPGSANVDRATPTVVVTTAGGPPPAAKPMPALLTSDIVLGFLDDLPPTESKVSVRFEPGMPQGATASAGLGPLSP